MMHRSTAAASPLRAAGAAFSALCVPLVLAPASSAEIAYICSDSTNTVFRYDIAQAGAPVMLTSVTGGFNTAAFISLRLNGDLLVNSRFGPSGGFLTNVLADACGEPGATVFHSAPGIFQTAFDVDVLADTAYMVDGQNGAQIVRFTFDAAGAPVLAGTTTMNVPAASGRGLVVHPGQRQVFVSACCSDSRVYRFDIQPDGSLGFAGFISGNGLNNPHGMVVTESGELFVANFFGNSVSRFLFAPDGAPVPNGTISGNSVNGPIGLGLAPWGELFVVGQGNSICSRFTFDGLGDAVANGTFNIPTSADEIIFASRPAPALVSRLESRACPANTVMLSVIGAAQSTILSFQWQRETAPGSGVFANLSDGAASWDDGEPGIGALISGSATDTLTIAPDAGAELGAAHTRLYRAVVTGDCAVSTTDASLLVVVDPSACPGDANFSGGVDFADLNIVLGNFGQASASDLVVGDGDCSGVVNFADLNLVLGNFGSECR